MKRVAAEGKMTRARYADPDLPKIGHVVTLKNLNFMIHLLLRKSFDLNYVLIGSATNIFGTVASGAQTMETKTNFTRIWGKRAECYKVAFQTGHDAADSL